MTGHNVTLQIEIKGVGTPQIPIAILTTPPGGAGEPFELDSEELRIRFQTMNKVARRVIITGLTVLLSGEAAHKLDVRLLSSTMSMQPATSGVTVAENEIIVTPKEVFLEGDSAFITLSGTQT
ncbi:MAG: hypothetical protein ACXABY_14595 [Candidatus Thorarchaeota archaeon]|jgi:hypothetical protein